MRRVVRLVATLALTVAAVLCLSGSASAGIDVPGVNVDCKDSPTPQLPGRGPTGFIESRPQVLPADEDPFAEGASVSIYEVYGYAGLRFSTYDLGCGPDLARNPDAPIGTTLANWLFQFPKAWTAVTGATVGAAFEPDFLGVLDPLIERVVDALRVAVFERWAFVVIAAMGMLLIWRSRKQRMSESAAAIGWAMLVMVLVTLVFRFPLVAGHAADQSASNVLTAASQTLTSTDSDVSAGGAATAALHESLLYSMWLAGTLGSSDSATAREYGPRIFKATALTWREAAVLEEDPEKGREIIDRKKDEYEAAAEDLKNADPDAYEHLTGKVSDDRVGYALLALIATLCAVPFLFVAGLLVIGALLIVRFGVMLFPVFATLGMFPTMRALVTGMCGTVVAAMFNALAFGIGASVNVLAMGVILTSPEPGWLKIVLLLLLTGIMWMFLSPFRRLTRMVSGDGLKDTFADAVSSPVRNAKSAGRFAARAATLAASGGAAGVVAGAAVADERRAQQRAEGAEVAETSVTVTATSLPTAADPHIPAPRRAIAASDSPQPERVALPPAPSRPGGTDMAEVFAPHRQTGERPGDDGSPIEGTVLPKVRYETEE